CSVISLLFLLFLFFLSIIPLPPIATLFPYTTLFRSHRELGAAGLDPLVVALHVVGVEHGRRLALLKHRLLIRFGRGVVVQRQLQLSAVRLLGRGHRQPSKWALTEIGLLGKAQYLRIEA